VNPKVSVIIPVYNTAPYLRRCLDSVCNQTLRDIEIICVDDASTDNSLGILNEYAARDKRIRIIPFSENRGECAARNAALDIAAGEYMGGCDSDDYIDLNFYKSLLDGKRVGGGEADIVYADHFIIHGKDGKTRKSLQTRYRIHHAIMLCKIALLRQFSIDYPEELRVGGDSVFFCKLYKYADAMKKINVTDTYHYYIYENSLSNSAITREKILIHKQMYEMLITLLNSFDEQKIERVPLRFL
jgi:glycosyltransferase involved in cell wall biosynthesis